MTGGDADAFNDRSDLAVLNRRARDLARRPEEQTAVDVIEVVRFAIAGEHYAVESRGVLAVFALVESVVPIPGAAASVAGITVWRGTLLTVLDVRAALGLSPSALNDLRNAIVLGNGGSIAGILVDTVDGIETRILGALQPPSPGEVRGDFVRGIWNDAVMLMDGAALVPHHGTGGVPR